MAGLTSLACRRAQTLPWHWQSPDGRCIAIKPLERSAAGSYRQFVRQLSPSSRSLRFLMPMQDLSESALDYLVDVDQCRQVAWMAADCRNPGSLIAEARYARTTCAEAEVALAVADEWQDQGVGQQLLRRLVEHTRLAGTERVWGRVRPDNGAILAGARRLGFSVRPDPCESDLLLVERALDAGAAGPRRPALPS